MMTSKSFLRFHPRPDKVQRQMTSLMPQLQAEDHLVIDSGHIKFLLSMTPAW